MLLFCHGIQLQNLESLSEYQSTCSYTKQNQSGVVLSFFVVSSPFLRLSFHLVFHKFLDSFTGVISLHSSAPKEILLKRTMKLFVPLHQKILNGNLPIKRPTDKGLRFNSYIKGLSLSLHPFKSPANRNLTHFHVVVFGAAFFSIGCHPSPIYWDAILRAAKLRNNCLNVKKKYLIDLQRLKS